MPEPTKTSSLSYPTQEEAQNDRATWAAAWGLEISEVSAQQVAGVWHVVSKQAVPESAADWSPYTDANGQPWALTVGLGSLYALNR